MAESPFRMATMAARSARVLEPAVRPTVGLQVTADGRGRVGVARNMGVTDSR